MCGIMGYTGPLDASEVILNGLEQLEYRGYDSAGLALTGVDSTISIFKKVGKVANLKAEKSQMPSNAHTGIGHTRWATHGGVTDINAHPHRAGRVTLIHNGIIENYLELKKDLIAKGYEFISETDTEVVAHFLDSLYEVDLLEAVKKSLTIINAAYALGMMSIS